MIRREITLLPVFGQPVVNRSKRWTRKITSTEQYRGTSIKCDLHKAAARRLCAECSYSIGRHTPACAAALSRTRELLPASSSSFVFDSADRKSEINPL